MGDEKIKAHFRTIGLKTSSPWELFRMLDVNKTYMIDKEEFIQGCLHLKDNATKLDMAILMTEFRQATSLWKKLLPELRPETGATPMHISERSASPRNVNDKMDSNAKGLSPTDKRCNRF